MELLEFRRRMLADYVKEDETKRHEQQQHQVQQQQQQQHDKNEVMPSISKANKEEKLN